MQILLFFIFGWIVTALVIIAFHAFFYSHVTEVISEVFVAWSGELLFFTIVGLAVTLITVEKPEDPRSRPVADRIKILFGISQVPDVMIRYTEELLEGMARYAKDVKRCVTVTDYDPQINAYKVQVTISYAVQNVLHDKPITESIPFTIEPDKFDNFSNAEMGKINSVVVGGSEKINAYTPIKIDGFSTNLEFTIPASGSVDIEFDYEVWMKCDEPQTVVAKRLVETSQLHFVNRIAQSPVVTIKGASQEITLLFNQPTSPYEVQGVPPGRDVHEFLFKSPGAVPSVDQGSTPQAEHPRPDHSS